MTLNLTIILVRELSHTLICVTPLVLNVAATQTSVQESSRTKMLVK